MPDLLLLALVVWDLKSRGRIHPATLWGGALVVAAQLLPLIVWHSAGWLSFARWSTGLVA